MTTPRLFVAWGIVNCAVIIALALHFLRTTGLSALPLVGLMVALVITGYVTRLNWELSKRARRTAARRGFSC